MENLLNKIKELVAAYNELPNAKRVVVVPEEYAKNANFPMEEKINDVSTYYICMYDDGKVGLFKELKYSSGKEMLVGHEKWNAGSLFLGVESNLVGIKVTHSDFSFVSSWKKEGETETVDQKRYVCNCNMHDAIPFDDMRLIMYENGEISSYKLGQATDHDLVRVLKYAKKYYEGKILVEPPQKIKK